MDTVPFVCTAILCSVVLCHGVFAEVQTIASIQFHGLKKTNEDFVLRFIESRSGSLYSVERMGRDIQILRNLRLFSHVAPVVTQSDSGYDVHIAIREFRSLVPLVNFGGISGNFWYQLGLSENNAFGRGYTIGGSYRYYDRHSLEFNFDLPHLISHSWGFSSILASHATTEPAYFATGTTQYDVDRRSVNLMILHAFSPRFSVRTGGTYLSERYEKNTDESGADAPGPELAEFTKYLGRSVISLDFLDYNLFHVQGHTHRLEGEIVRTKGEDDIFWKALYVGKVFHPVFGTGDTGARLRLGLAENKETVFLPFVLDSYINVRGSGNRIARGSAELTVNLEHRQTLYERPWWGLQGVLFLDWSGWRRAGKDVSTMFNRENIVTFSGIGIRFHHWKAYNIILRIDYGWDLNDVSNGGFVLGFGQYF